MSLALFFFCLHDLRNVFGPIGGVTEQQSPAIWGRTPITHPLFFQYFLFLFFSLFLTYTVSCCYGSVLLVIHAQYWSFTVQCIILIYLDKLPKNMPLKAVQYNIGYITAFVVICMDIQFSSLCLPIE